jgi:hypothetical protein
MPKAHGEGTERHGEKLCEALCLLCALRVPEKLGVRESYTLRGSGIYIASLDPSPHFCYVR